MAEFYSARSRVLRPPQWSSIAPPLTSGKADAKPYGNGDGKVDYAELGRYFKETLTYYARRYYGRDQNAQIVVGK